MDEIKKAFEKYDSDGNGYITTDEAHEVLQNELGFDSEKTTTLIKVYDRNGDGKLSYKEFIWFYWKIQEKKEGIQEAMQKMFSKFDQDKSNSISFEEAMSLLKEFDFNENEIKDLINIHDSNKDGVLQYDEFVNFWQACVGKVSDEN